MQAIQTKYLPATNRRGSRIKAICDRGSITIDYPHELSGDMAHRQAVNALVAKFAREDKARWPEMDMNKNPWLRPFVTGGLPDNTLVHVFIS